MGDAVDRALSENQALISAIVEHHTAGRDAPAVALLERLQINLEFIAAVAEHGIPLPAPPAAAPVATAPICAPMRIAPAVTPVAERVMQSSTWRADEHARFEEGMRLHGEEREGRPNFNKIATVVQTRTPVQVRSHYQKVVKKMDKEGGE